VVSTSSSNSRLINRDNSTIGVGNQTSIGSISSSIVVRSRGIDTSIDTLGSKVVSTGSSNSGLISRSDSTVGVSNKGGDVEGSAVSISGSSNNRGSIISNSWGSGDNRGGSNNRGSSSISGTLGSKVVSTGSNNSRLISRGHGSVGVGNKAGDMEGSTVGISGSIGGSSSNDRGSIISSNNRGSSSNNGSSGNNRGSSGISSTLSSKMISTGSSNSRLINRGHSSVGVGNKAWDISISSSISIASSVVVSRGISSKLSGKMISLGGSNSWFIKGSNSSIGMGLESIESSRG